MRMPADEKPHRHDRQHARAVHFFGRDECRKGREERDDGFLQRIVHQLVQPHDQPSEQQPDPNAQHHRERSGDDRGFP